MINRRNIAIQKLNDLAGPIFVSFETKDEDVIFNNEVSKKKTIQLN